jgi:hypothetical protein
MDISARASLVTLRLAALVIMIACVAALCDFMLWLPWQVDGILAMGASFAYAYKFEREEPQ